LKQVEISPSENSKKTTENGKTVCAHDFAHLESTWKQNLTEMF